MGSQTCPPPLHPASCKSDETQKDPGQDYKLGSQELPFQGVKGVILWTAV